MKISIAVVPVCLLVVLATGLSAVPRAQASSQAIQGDGFGQLNCSSLRWHIDFFGTKGDGLGPPQGVWNIALAPGFEASGPITGGAYSNTNFNLNGEVSISSRVCTPEGTQLSPGTQVLIKGDCTIEMMKSSQIFFKANNGVEGNFVGVVSCPVF